MKNVKLVALITILALLQFCLAQESGVWFSNETNITYSNFLQAPPRFPEYAPGGLIVKTYSGSPIDPQVADAANAQISEKSLDSPPVDGSSIAPRRVFNIRPDDELAKQIGLDRIYEYRLPYVLDMEELAREVSKLPDVEYAEPNYLARTSFVPNDPLYPQQWSHQHSNAEAGWDVELGNGSVVIAIADTGVDYSHEDLAGNMLADCTGGCPDGTGYDFVDIDTAAYEAMGFSLAPEEDYTQPDDMPSDYFGHGTHCAGIAGAATNNSIGVAGVCHNCRIMPVRNGFGVYYGGYAYGILEHDDISASIHYAADNGVRVISMSFGGPHSGMEQDAIEYAHGMGVVLVAAAGNSGMRERNYPGAYDNVIAVTATDLNDAKAYYSTYGYWTDMAAPGGHPEGTGILSTVPIFGPLGSPSGYRELRGTSMATPYVAGAAGLIISHNQSFNPAQVEQILKQTAIPAGCYFPDCYIGAGRVNVSGAVRVSLMPNLVASIDSPESGVILPISSGTQTVEVIGSAIGGANYSLYYGEGYYPGSWTVIAEGTSVENGILGTWGIGTLSDGWHALRLVVRSDAGNFEQKAFYFTMNQKQGWPFFTGSSIYSTPAVGDVNNDGMSEIFLSAKNGYFYLLDSDGNLMPGWPASFDEGVWPEPGWDWAANSPLLISDLDLDCTPELIARGTMKVYVFNPDGTEKEGWPFELPGDYEHWGTNGNLLGSPTAVDLDGDGYKELMVPGGQNLYVLNHTGEVRSGWPRQMGQWPAVGAAFTTAAAGDFDSDGQLEIAYVVMDDNNLQTGVEILEADGSVSNAWTIDERAGWMAAPVINDFDGDCLPDLAIASFYNIYRFDAQGNPLPGWTNVPTELPKYLMLSDLNDDGSVELASNSNSESFARIIDENGTTIGSVPTRCGQDFSVVSADVSGDGQDDLITAEGGGCGASFSYLSGVGAYRANDSQNAIWRMRLPRGMRSAPVIADIDNDGMLEMVGTTGDDGAYYGWTGEEGDGGVYVWELGTPESSMQWPEYHHDPVRSGNYMGAQESVELRISSPKGGDVYREGLSVDGCIWSHGGGNYEIEYAPVGTEDWSADGIALERDGNLPVQNGRLANFSLPADTQSGFYKMRIAVFGSGGEQELGEEFATVRMGRELREGFPVKIPSTSHDYPIPVIKNVDADEGKEIIFASRSPDNSASAVYVVGADGAIESTVISAPDSLPNLNRLSLLVSDIGSNGIMDAIYAKGGVSESEAYRTVAQSLLGQAVWENEIQNAGRAGQFGAYAMSADLEHDGQKELVYIVPGPTQISHTKLIYVTNLSGQIRPGWPQSVPDCFPREGVQQSPIVADLDSDSDLEIFYAGDWENCNVPGGKAFAFNANGTAVPGWPVAFASPARASATSADINYDNRDELLIPTRDGLLAYRGNGTLLWTALLGQMPETPAVANLDSVGGLEIIASVTGTAHGIRVLNSTGAVIGQWDSALGWDDRLGPVIGDVNWDGEPDILYEDVENVSGTYFGALRAKSMNGTDAMPAKYVELDALGSQGKVVADIDGDGMLDIVSGSGGSQRYETGNPT